MTDDERRATMSRDIDAMNDEDPHLEARIHRLADAHQETRMQVRETAMRMTMVEKDLANVKATAVTTQQLSSFSENIGLRLDTVKAHQETANTAITAIQDVINRVAWIIVAAVIAALLGLVVYRPWIPFPAPGRQQQGQP
jgi:Mg2+ and Co2+ transporter CorA